MVFFVGGDRLFNRNECPDAFVVYRRQEAFQEGLSWGLIVEKGNEMKRYRIFLTNCDCASDIKALVERKFNFMIGPRCPSCHKILGPMQHTDTGQVFKARGDIEAIQMYHKVRGRWK